MCMIHALWQIRYFGKQTTWGAFERKPSVFSWLLNWLKPLRSSSVCTRPPAYHVLMKRKDIVTYSKTFWLIVRVSSLPCYLHVCYRWSYSMSLMSGYLCHLILCATSLVILLLMLPYSSCYHGSYSFSYIVTCITLFPVLAWVLLLQLSCYLHYLFLCFTVGLTSWVILLITSVTSHTLSVILFVVLPYSLCYHRSK